MENTNKPRHDKILEHLKLAQILAASAEGLSLDELEQETGIKRRTLQRMKSALSEIFQMDVVEVEKKARFRILHGLGSFLNSPTPDELAELQTAAQQLSKMGAGTRADLLNSLSRKMTGALRQRERSRLAPDVEIINDNQMSIAYAGPSVSYKSETLTQLKRAIVIESKVSFNYVTGYGRESEKTIDPHGLMLGRISYLVGYHNDWGDPTNYRLDRISNIIVLNEPRQKRDAFDLQGYAAQSFGVFQQNIFDIELRFSKAVAFDVKNYTFHPSQELIPQKNGDIIVTMKTGGLRELAWHLFTWGQDIKILAPEELKVEMQERIALALKSIE